MPKTPLKRIANVVMSYQKKIFRCIVAVDFVYHAVDNRGEFIVTDEEINSLVARKLGFNLCKGHCILAGIINEDGWHSPIPDYCHSIAAAWDVVQFMNNKGHFVRILTGGAGVQEISVGIQHEAFGAVGLSHAQNTIEKTVPMALCLAFLKLSNGSKD